MEKLFSQKNTDIFLRGHESLQGSVFRFNCQYDETGYVPDMSVEICYSFRHKPCANLIMLNISNPEGNMDSLDSENLEHILLLPRVKKINETLTVG